MLVGRLLEVTVDAVGRPRLDLDGAVRRWTPRTGTWRPSQTSTWIRRHRSRELGPRGITVNSVSPGVILTRNNTYLSDDEEAAQAAARVALGRLGQSEDVADSGTPTPHSKDDVYTPGNTGSRLTQGSEGRSAPPQAVDSHFLGPPGHDGSLSRRLRRTARGRPAIRQQRRRFAPTT